MIAELTERLALAGLIDGAGRITRRASGDVGRVGDGEEQGDFVQRFLPEPWRAAARNEGLIVPLAGRLAAGERRGESGDEEPRVQPPRQLLSIFSVLEADGVLQSSAEQRFLPLRPLELARETLFPRQSMDDEELRRAHAGLREGFEGELARLKAVHDEEPDLRSYLESLLLLMQRYLWCLPAAGGNGLPDVSVYDHGRVTGALAAVLGRDGVEAETLGRWGADPASIEEDVALLVGGDISGVQDFIYTITARGAAPTLRGRSFFVQMLTDALARYLLRRLALPVTNLIYAGGGSFFLLARPEDAERLPALQREISRILLQQHRGELYAAVAGAPLAGKDFFDGAIGRCWGDVHDALRRKKLQRFAELDDELARLFQAAGHGGNEERMCQVCGQEHVQTAAEAEDPAAEPVRKCPSCRAFEDLGDDLRNARFLVQGETDAPATRPFDPDRPAGTWKETLAGLGMRIELSDDAPNTPSAGRRLRLALDDAGLCELGPRAGAAAGRRFLVNRAPTLTEEDRSDATLTDAERDELPPADKVKPFSLLAHQSCGIRRLGILRMDVDNLGQLFQHGFGERASITRIAALSFAVSLYFEGWVGRLVEDAEPQGAQIQRDRIYTIYSGGDDLFFAGSWDAMLALAVRIRADLTDYAAGHRGIHASAGVALVGAKYPLAQAAQEADAAEKAAKGVTWRDGDEERRKDAIAFLGTALPWSTFGLQADSSGNLETAQGLMRRLVALSTGEGGAAAPRAFVRTLIDLHRQYADAQERWSEERPVQDASGPPQLFLGPWVWRAAYALTRLQERTGSEDVKRAIEEVRERLPAGGYRMYRMMEWLGVAAAWADLLIRRRE